MISLRYTITKEDYINFYTHVMWDATDKRKARVKSIARQLGFVAIFISVYYFAGGFRILSKISASIILLMFATSLLPLLGGRGAVAREAEDIADDPENASVFTEHLLLASDAGVEVKTDTSDMKYSWQAFTRRTENPAYFFLFLNAIHAVIIPKKIFDDSAEIEFKKLLTRNLSLEADIKDAMLDAGE